MPAIKTTANTSGAALWNQNTHKKGSLLGLKVDNQSANPMKLDLLDCFTTTASKANSNSATQAAEDFQTAVASGKVRFQMTVPTGDFVSLGKEDLREVTFLGKAYVRGDATTSDCVVVATYKLK
jgi:hypothetical protein